MTVLLDTHTLLWWLNDSPRLGPAARAGIADPGNEVLVSAVTAWEITTKYRIGRLPEAAAIVAALDDAVTAEGFGTLPITFAHAQRAGCLPGEQRDPFDRMLIAQALTENVPLLSLDPMFEQFGVRRIW